jgi:hypothetical protein
VAIFPNPARQSFKLSLPPNFEAVTYTISDSKGSQKASGKVPSGLSDHEISLSNISCGIYQVMIQASGFSRSMKLVVE